MVHRVRYREIGISFPACGVGAETRHIEFNLYYENRKCTSLVFIVRRPRVIESTNGLIKTKLINFVVLLRVWQNIHESE